MADALALLLFRQELTPQRRQVVHAAVAAAPEVVMVGAGLVKVAGNYVASGRNLALARAASELHGLFGFGNLIATHDIAESVDVFLLDPVGRHLARVGGAADNLDGNNNACCHDGGDNGKDNFGSIRVHQESKSGGIRNPKSGTGAVKLMGALTLVQLVLRFLHC